MHCQSNLHQLGVAVTGYIAAHQAFPPGQCGGQTGFGADAAAWSWLAQILPYIEENNLYQEGGVSYKTLRKSGIMDTQIPLFLCPSDPLSCRGPRTDAGNLVGVAVGQTNYKGVSGANWGADASQKLTNIDTLWSNPGKNGSADGLNEGDGILWRCDGSTHLSPVNVTDGMSHTFLIGEDVPSKDTWCSWPYANNAYSTCAIPPNFTFTDPNWWPNTQSFRSNHAGGVNFAFGDGSVQFIRDSIALGTYLGASHPRGRRDGGGVLIYRLCRLQLPAVGDHHFRRGPAVLAAVALHLLHHVHTLDDLAEDDVLAVEPGRLEGDEELRAVGVRAGVGHAEDARPGVLELEVLVVELAAVDRLAAGAVGRVKSPPWHMKLGMMRWKVRALVAEALLAGAQGAEVLGRLRHHVRAESPSRSGPAACRPRSRPRNTRGNLSSAAAMRHPPRIRVKVASGKQKRSSRDHNGPFRLVARDRWPASGYSPPATTQYL